MDITEFLQTSYTPYHAVQNGIAMLKEHGFVPFDPAQDVATVGGRYYVTLADSTLIALVLGDTPCPMLAVSHTDSPCLKVRGTVDSPLGKRLDVESYGGLLNRSMLDIPCRVAGRVVCASEGGVYSQIVTSDFAVIIPSLCIHHGGDSIELKVQNDMMPLLGGCDLYQALGIRDKVLDADLYVVPDVVPFAAGAQNEFLCAPRIDNLTSVYTSLKALCEANPKGVAVCACFDNEETGSRTRQSAGGDLLCRVLASAMQPYGCTMQAACSRGLALSIDNGHSVHPAHPERSAPNGQVLMNGGVVIKHNPNYATDALSGGMFKYILQQAALPYQDFHNHADVRCGGTLGLMSARQLLIPTCDIGLAQLAMHSAVETVGAKDVDIMQRALTAFFNALIYPDEAGYCRIETR